MSVHQNSTLRAGLWALAVFAAQVLPAGDANAQIGAILCSVYTDIIVAEVGRGVATIAVASLGIGAMLGKISWGMAIMVGVGVGALFGAGAIVEAVLPNVTAC